MRCCGRLLYPRTNAEDVGAANGTAQPAIDVKSLHAKIGELTLENDPKKRRDQLLAPRAEEQTRMPWHAGVDC